MEPYPPGFTLQCERSTANLTLRHAAKVPSCLQSILGAFHPPFQMHARTLGPHEKHAHRPRVPDLSELFRHVSYAVFRSTSRPTKVHKSSKHQSGLQGPMGLASDLFRWTTRTHRALRFSEKYPDRRQLPTRNLPSSSSKHMLHLVISCENHQPRQRLDKLAVNRR
ncbi:hypothetical protein CNYM01_13209 [Colletotrichum nymphaeae SA-01]|uniref:Uncharacterized protein n=1 Tax=Colletotrichum nymphaeae SA-01 TaxID=1460502 RepID=A0A135UVW9_9PEZI|nr:hypothetical protein CNYM01_13209 [Colletotrichum nymphaeae SA-01]